MTGSDGLRVVVYPHSMELGGSQLNAVELAAAVRDRGHDVILYAEDGELTATVRSLGLRHVFAPPGGHRPSVRTARHLAAILHDQRTDVVHGYEWPPALEAYAATMLTGHVAAVATVMSMAVAPFIPRSMPLTVGTERIRAHAATRRSGPTTLIEPPVDTEANQPGGRGAAFRQAYALQHEEIVVVVVSRLVRELKLEGILTAIRAMPKLVAPRPCRLVVVGDGPARAEVHEAAAKANAEAGRPVVVVTGALPDPRGAYDAADIVLGMGGSALRGIAFAKPLVVQGEQGFFELLAPESVDRFLVQGWYGTGPGADAASAEQRFVAVVTPLLDDVGRRADLGRFGRELVEARFSLRHAAELQESIYRSAVAKRTALARRGADVAVAGAGLLRYKVERRRARARGAASTDDFNARPL